MSATPRLRQALSHAVDWCERVTRVHNLLADNHIKLQKWMDTHYTATEQDVLKRRAEEE